MCCSLVRPDALYRGLVCCAIIGMMWISAVCSMAQCVIVHPVLCVLCLSVCVCVCVCLLVCAFRVLFWFWFWFLLLLFLFVKFGHLAG